MTHAHTNLSVVELNDLPRLGRLHVRDPEQSLREVLVVLGSNKLHREANVVKFQLIARALGPIRMTFDLFLFDDFVEHENGF